MNHKQKVLLQLDSNQGEETLSQHMLGEWYVKDKSFYLKYAEQTEAGEVRHLLRYEPPALKVTRKGAVDAEQAFRVHERWPGHFYQGPLSITTEAYTKRLVIKDKYDQAVLGMPAALPFTLSWEYELYVGEQLTGTFNLRLLVREATVS